MFQLLSSLILILWYMNLVNNGQMDRGNENPTQHLPWWLRKTTKNPQSGWSAPGFEPGTSRMRVSCITTEPPRSVILFSIYPYISYEHDKPKSLIYLEVQVFLFALIFLKSWFFFTFLYGRPRWSSGYHTCLWIRGSRVRAQPWSMNFFQSVKILSMTSFGREIKPCMYMYVCIFEVLGRVNISGHWRP